MELTLGGILIIVPRRKKGKYEYFQRLVGGGERLDKLEKLREILKGYGKVAIAYSGGCDSNFLMNIAVDTLGKENVLAVLCNGAMMSKEDKKQAKELLKDWHYKIIDVDVLSVEAFKYNHQDRCYHCKKMIMTNVIKTAHEAGYNYVLDGKNLDDEGVYRPGIKACLELGILSPLSEAKMTKKEIRDYSKQCGIVTHDKPANACLATRFDYNTEITNELLEKADQAEALFHALNIGHVRVRIQDKLARIEVEPEYFATIIENKELVKNLKELGFRYITLDLEGIKSGSYDK